MTKIRRKFAKNLKKIRMSRGLTQEELAEALGINPRYVQLLEGSKTPNVKLDTIEELARVLKSKPADFFL